MLVLSRKIDEEIRIGDDVIITVVQLAGGRVRIGIKAPLSVPVHREEVYQKIQKEKLEEIES